MSTFPRTTRRGTARRSVPPGRAQTRVGKHVYAADETIPADHRGRQTCSTCHCLGGIGDARHYGPDDDAEQYPVQDPEARQLELRRLGERDD